MFVISLPPCFYFQLSYVWMLTTYALKILLYRACQLTDFVIFPTFNNSYVFLLFPCFVTRCYFSALVKTYTLSLLANSNTCLRFPRLQWTVTRGYFSRACKQSYFVTEAFRCEKGYEEEEEEGAGKESSLISPSAPLLIFFCPRPNLRAG